MPGFLNIYDATGGTTLGTEADYSLDTERVKYAASYKFSAPSAYFSYLNSTATRVVIARLDGEEATDTGTVGTAHLQEDTGSGYGDIAGTDLYTYHSNVTTPDKDTAYAFIADSYDADDAIKLRAAAGSGTPETSVGCALIAFDAPSDVVDVYDGTGATPGSGYTNFTFGTTRKVDTGSFSVSGAEITINATDTYLVLVRMTGGNAGTSSVINFKLQEDTGGGYGDVTGAIGHAYAPSSGLNNTGQFAVLKDWTDTDKIKVQYQDPGVRADAIAEGSSLVALRITTPAFSAYYNTTTSISTSPTWDDIALVTERKKDSEYTHSGTSAEVTIGEDGVYLAIGQLVAVFNGSVSEPHVRIALDTGSGYSAVPGTDAKGITVSGPSADDTVLTIALLTLYSGDKVKVQVTSEGNAVDMDAGSGLILVQMTSGISGQVSSLGMVSAEVGDTGRISSLGMVSAEVGDTGRVASLGLIVASWSRDFPPDVGVVQGERIERRSNMQGMRLKHRRSQMS